MILHSGDGSFTKPQKSIRPLKETIPFLANQHFVALPEFLLGLKRTLNLGQFCPLCLFVYLLLFVLSPPPPPILAFFIFLFWCRLINRGRHHIHPAVEMGTWCLLERQPGINGHLTSYSLGALQGMSGPPLSPRAPTAHAPLPPKLRRVLRLARNAKPGRNR